MTKLSIETQPLIDKTRDQIVALQVQADKLYAELLASLNIEEKSKTEEWLLEYVYNTPAITASDYYKDYVFGNLFTTGND